MKIVVVAAMRSELRAFQRRRAPGDGAATGVLGIGTALARASTEQLLDEHDPDHLLVIGVAGGIGAGTSVGDLVVPEIVLDGATGEEHRPAPIPGLVNSGVLHTSDRLVGPSEADELVARGVVALDMETAAVASVCGRRGVAWSVMRGISDHVDDPVDPGVLGMVGPEGQARPLAVLSYVARNPGRLRRMAQLAKGLDAATGASADAAAAAIARLSRPAGG